MKTSFLLSNLAALLILLTSGKLPEYNKVGLNAQHLVTEISTLKVTTHNSSETFPISESSTAAKANESFNLASKLLTTLKFEVSKFEANNLPDYEYETLALDYLRFDVKHFDENAAEDDVMEYSIQKYKFNVSDFDNDTNSETMPDTETEKYKFDVNQYYKVKDGDYLTTEV